MAISTIDPMVLMLEGQRAEFDGDILTLGRQQIAASPRQIQSQAAALGYHLRHRLSMSGRPITDTEFFSALGFRSVSSLDNSDYEGATFIHDLNQADLPHDLESKFDVIFDRGTSEHVFNLPHLLAAVARMVKPGGRVIHYVPSSNHIDHGFYMFSPTLFVDYYVANGFELPTLWIVVQPWLRVRPRVEIFEYLPGSLEAVNHGGLDGRGYQIFCVAVRRQQSTHSIMPQQSRYAKAWNRNDRGSSVPESTAYP
jgi:SAM-dependent methyltransferase